MTETAQLLRSLADHVFGSQTAELRPGPARLGRLWDTIRELEWPLVGIPESLGGAGGDLEDVLALAEGVGRNAVNIPLLPAHSAYAVAAAGGRTDLLAKRLVVETQPRWSSLRVEELGRQLRISGDGTAYPVGPARRRPADPCAGGGRVSLDRLRSPRSRGHGHPRAQSRGRTSR